MGFTKIQGGLLIAACVQLIDGKKTPLGVLKSQIRRRLGAEKPISYDCCSCFRNRLGGCGYKRGCWGLCCDERRCEPDEIRNRRKESYVSLETQQATTAGLTPEQIELQRIQRHRDVIVEITAKEWKIGKRRKKLKQNFGDDFDDQDWEKERKKKTLEEEKKKPDVKDLNIPVVIYGKAYEVTMKLKALGLKEDDFTICDDPFRQTEVQYDYRKKEPNRSSSQGNQVHPETTIEESETSMTSTNGSVSSSALTPTEELNMEALTPPPFPSLRRAPPTTRLEPSSTTRESEVNASPDPK